MRYMTHRAVPFIAEYRGKLAFWQGARKIAPRQVGWSIAKSNRVQEFIKGMQRASYLIDHHKVDSDRFYSRQAKAIALAA